MTDAADNQSTTGRRGRRSRPSHPDRPCPNCGDPTSGEYCPTCGQRKAEVQVSVRMLIMDVLEDQFILDQRLPRTLTALLLRPGHLTNEFMSGRIVRYIHPFRLYLASSLVFFLLLSFLSLQFVRSALDQEVGARPEAVQVDSLTEEVADLTSALAELDRTAADTAIPGAVREVLRSNRALVEARLSAATARRDTMQRDTAGAAAGDTAIASAPARDRPADPRQPPLRERFGWEDDEPTIGIANPRLRATVEAQVERIGDMTPRQAAETMIDTFFNYVPTVMFILLPVFAVVLKLLYIRRRRYYAEHFVFLLHVHSVVFILTSLMLLLRNWLPTWLDALLILWILVYIYIAMKRVYGQGWFRTLVKYWILGWAYLMILSVSAPIAVLATLLLF